MITREQVIEALQGMRDLFVELRDEVKDKADRDEVDRVATGILNQTMERVESNNQNTLTNLPGTIDKAVDRNLEEKIDARVKKALEEIRAAEAAAAAYEDEKKQSKWKRFFTWVGYATGVLLFFSALAGLWFTFFDTSDPRINEIRRTVDSLDDLGG